MSDSDTKSPKQKVTPARAAVAKAAILDHVQVVGGKNWRDVFELFPDIPVSTMWRWARELKRANPPPEAIALARANIRSVTEGVEIARAVEARAAGVEEIARHIPAAPSPAYLATSGQQGMNNLNFMVEFRRLYADAEMLRTYSVNAAKEGEPEKIKNPLAFDRSVQRRLSVLEGYVKVSQQIYDVRMMADFYDSIIAEIKAEQPQVAQRIMKRLADLNARRGMTIDLQV